MTTRIFSHKHQLYTNSPFWPSNQHSFSDWLINPEGKVVEAVYFQESSYPDLVVHDSKDFAVEPWTGLFDSKGKKIYLGDIIKLNNTSYVYEVVWNFDRFIVKYSDSPANVTREMFNRCDLEANFSVVSTIHSVNF